MKKEIKCPDGSKIKLLEKIGGGAKGDVYRSLWARSGGTVEWVAVKILKNVDAGNNDELAALEREIKNLETISHANIVSYRGHGVDPKLGHYIVTELIDGISLSDFLKRHGTLPEAVANWIIYEVATALSYLHEVKKIIHRDLAPKNIMLSREGRVVLIDFGLAKELTGNTVSATMDGQLGTPGYFSPEIAWDRKPVFASDTFALGIILTECLTNKNPYKLTTVTSLALTRESETGGQCERLVRDAGFEKEAYLVGSILKQRPEERLSLSEILKLTWVDANNRSNGRESFSQRWVGHLVCELCPEKLRPPRGRLKRGDFLSPLLIAISSLAVGTLYITTKPKSAAVVVPPVLTPVSSPSPSQSMLSDPPVRDDEPYSRIFWKDENGTKEISPEGPQAVSKKSPLIYPASRAACDQIYAYIVKTLGSSGAAPSGFSVLKRAKVVLETKSELGITDAYCMALRDTLADIHIDPQDEKPGATFASVFDLNFKKYPSDGDRDLEDYYFKFITPKSPSYLEHAETGQFDIFLLNAGPVRENARAKILKGESECQAVGDALYFKQFIGYWLETDGVEDDSLPLLIVPGTSKIVGNGFVKVDGESVPVISRSSESAGSGKDDPIFKDGICRYFRIGGEVSASLWIPKYPF